MVRKDLIAEVINSTLRDIQECAIKRRVRKGSPRRSK
jgi:hypothetical protein